VTAVVLAVVLAGCGHGASTSTADGVRKDLASTLSHGGAAQCNARTYATQRFIDQRSFSIPALAREIEALCRKHPSTFASGLLRVSRVRIDGDRGTARLIDGGLFADGSVDVDIAKDGVWKLDRITRVDVDRREYVDALFGFSSTGGDDSTRTQRSCTRRRLGRLSDRQLRRAIVGAEVKLVVDPVLVCFMRPQLRAEGLSISLVSCLLKRLQRKGRRLVAVSLREDKRELRALFHSVAADCAPARSVAA